MKGREHMVKNEIIVLKRVSQGHKNILTLVDYFETPNNLYLITDVARGDELFDRIYNKGSFYESDAVNIICSIASGVAYLHKHGIVHRDLKPENLLFRTMDEDSDLLIADFGLSRIIDEERFRMLTTTCGTPAYMAPEIFRKSGHGKPVDVWAIGVITYFLLCGYTPFDHDSSMEEMQAILDCDYAFEPEEYWEDVSEEAKDFISRCLQGEIEKRMTADECLAHKFLDTKRFGNTSPVSETQANKDKKSGDMASDSSAIKASESGSNEANEEKSDAKGKPRKKESDLLPTVRSNLSLRRLTGSSQDGMSVGALSSFAMTSLSMSPMTSATSDGNNDHNNDIRSTNGVDGKGLSNGVTKAIDISKPKKEKLVLELSDNQTMDGAFSKSPEINS